MRSVFILPDSNRILERHGLRLDARHQVVPGLVERLGAVALELSGERIEVIPAC
jgi:hypothetical protein